MTHIIDGMTDFLEVGKKTHPKYLFFAGYHVSCVSVWTSFPFIMGN